MRITFLDDDSKLKLFDTSKHELISSIGPHLDPNSDDLDNYCEVWWYKTESGKFYQVCLSWENLSKTEKIVNSLTSIGCRDTENIKYTCVFKT